MENKEKRMIGEYTSHLLMRGGKVLTEPISKELNGVTYTVTPNSTVLAIDRDPYQGSLEVYCVIGMYEDASEAGPAMVFYSNDGEICYGVKLNHYGQRVESLLGVEYEINGTKGFFVRLNIERQGKEAVRKCLAELYGCDERNMLFKGNSSDEPLWML